MIGQDQIELLSTLGKSKEISVYGIEYEVRFHLHPDVTAQILDDDTVQMNSKYSGTWILEAFDLAPSFHPSYYFSEGHASPIPTQQVIFSARLNDFLKQVRWSLQKSYDIET